jgi:hypothetical protein
MSSIYENGGILGSANYYDDVTVLGPAGEAEYTTPGTYSWTCPEGVTSVCVVCVGGGGGGTQSGSGRSGAGGGGLGWKNNISVTPGSSYTVVVGSGGTRGVSTGAATAGGNSYFISAATVAGLGGGAASSTTVGGNGSGGGYVGDGGGNGGDGGVATGSTSAGGGGGAGGYTGNGGNGGGTSEDGSRGAGGGGGGSAGAGSADAGGGGGGVGIKGQGGTGRGGPFDNANGDLGEPGSGGSPGLNGDGPQGDGGAYGGGGGGADNTGNEHGNGAGGAVRIIWGNNVSFPSGLGKAKRSGIWSLPAVQKAYAEPQIVTDSLLLYLDAYNSESYPGSGTTWYDLAGSNNATLNGSAVYDAESKSIFFNGDGSSASGTSPTTSITNVTIMGFVRMPPAINQGGDIFKIGTSDGYGVGIGGQLTNLGANPGYLNSRDSYLTAIFELRSWIGSYTSYSPGWSMITMRLDSSSVPSFYINESEVTDWYFPGASNTPLTPTATYLINSGGARGSYVHVSNFLIYSKLLSAEEISQNFNAFRRRYGL